MGRCPVLENEMRIAAIATPDLPPFDLMHAEEPVLRSAGLLARADRTCPGRMIDMGVEQGPRWLDCATEQGILLFRAVLMRA